MKSKFSLRSALIFALALATFVEVDPVSLATGNSVSSEAMAKVGRPLTPRSVAGVGRRTTRRVVRRTVRRTGVYVASLPAGCAKISVNGAWYWHCGATYYQHTGTKYVVVHIN